MDYVTPADVVENMSTAGAAKGKLGIKDLVIRGILSGALLGISTTLAIQAQLQFGKAVVGGIIFPVGFVMIVLLGLELVTGNFAIVPLGVLSKKIGIGELGKNWTWVFIGNLLGGLLYAGLFYAATQSGQPITNRLVELAQSKTVAYEHLGKHGMMYVFFKAVLCNWMVTMGVVMAMTSSSTTGKILAMWLPVMVFFSQGFEHSVVNMFVIPVGMLYGAKVSFSEWWLWNQIPVTLGNIVGGFGLTGLTLYLTYGKVPLKLPSMSREAASRPSAMLEAAASSEGGS